MIDRLVTLLPQPDSPTRPMISPRSTWKSMPSTARTTPSRVWNEVRRPATSRSGRSPRSIAARRADAGTSSSMTVWSRRAQRAASGRRSVWSSVGHRFSRGSRASRRPSPSRLKPKHRQGEGDAREEDQVRGGEQLVPRSWPIMEPHSASGGCAPRPRNDSAATSRTAAAMPRVPATTIGVSALGRIRRKRSPRCALAERPRRGHVVALADREDRGAHDPGIDRDRDDADGDLGVDQARPERRHDRDREEQRRERPARRPSAA